MLIGIAAAVESGADQAPSQRWEWHRSTPKDDIRQRAGVNPDRCRCICADAEAIYPRAGDTGDSDYGRSEARILGA